LAVLLIFPEVFPAKSSITESEFVRRPPAKADEAGAWDAAAVPLPSAIFSNITTSVLKFSKDSIMQRHSVFESSKRTTLLPGM
jgi:hypothetical protein